jgi:peptidoglycan/xylan/chitin deacetylase (PgdA/CDA1 family)
MSIYLKIKRAVACLLIKDIQTLNLSEPLISFSFDDAPDSAFVTGKSTLQKYGYQGTYYISLGLKQEGNPHQSYFDTTHLKKVVSDGGDLACHTYNHIHLYTSEKNKILLDLDQNQKKVREFVPGYTFSNFSYPYGEQTISAKMVIRKKFRSARSVKAGINNNPIDLNNLKALQLEKNLPVENVYALIDQAVAENGWLIFYTHDIQENCSPWGCTPQYFEKVVKYCFEKKLNVQTIEKGLDKLNSGK